MTDPIDMSDKPRRTDWGSQTSAEGDTDYGIDDLVRARRDGDPYYKRIKNIRDQLDAGDEPLDRLFDGDASHDDLLVLAQSLVALYLQMSEIVDLAYANYDGPDPASIAGEVASMGLDILLAAAQPLQDAVGLALCNPERLGLSATMWRETEAALNTLSQHLSGAVADMLDVQWQGAARDAAVQRLAEYQDAVFTARLIAALLQELMERTAEFAQALNNRAKTLYVESIMDAVSLISMILGNPSSVVDVLLSTRSKLTRLALDIVNMLLAAGRIYEALSLLTDKLAEEFEKTTALLDRLAACR